MSAVAPAALDVTLLRRDFPVLGREVRGKPLVYLDNANTTQKPEAVIRATDRYYREENANVHRATQAHGAAVASPAGRLDGTRAGAASAGAITAHPGRIGRISAAGLRLGGRRRNAGQR